MKTYCILDTETTGLISNLLLNDQQQPEVIEFYAVKIDEDNNQLGELEFLCKPRHAISEEVRKITGITNDMVMEARPFAFYAKNVLDFMMGCDGVVAHNLSYDKDVLTIEFARCNLLGDLFWPRLKICTVEQTESLKGFRLSLSALHTELFGEAFAGAHRAKEDVQALRKCFHLLLSRGDI